jgi:hypothetical protein
MNNLVLYRTESCGSSVINLYLGSIKLDSDQIPTNPDKSFGILVHVCIE